MRVRALVISSLIGGSSLVSSPGQAERPAEVSPLAVASASRRVEPLDTQELVPLQQLETPKKLEDYEENAHRKGGRPRTPSARMPERVRLSTPNAKARRSVAGGATQDDEKVGPDDEQLRALRRAERVLFPEQVRGLRSNWSFDVPDSVDQRERTLGLPLTVQTTITSQAIAKQDVAWLRSLSMPDLPVRLDRRVVTYLKFYRDSQRGRTIAAIWTRKSGRYVAEMKAMLRRAGLPTDLVWLSMIESGHNPTIKSPAGALGLWQFMPESARMYGLTVDRWVDERRDPARSTQAAIRFLGDLYRRFGNWELAMGAYNMGYAGMSRAVAKYNTNDYWALSRMESGIPWETSLYVPKICALAIVMNNREAFGVGRQKLDPAVAFDTIMVEPATSLKQIARAADLSVTEVLEANPQYLTTTLPPQSSGLLAKWPVRVPDGDGERVMKKLAKSVSSRKVHTYRVLMGDTEKRIAELYGVSVSSLSRMNHLRKNELLAPGTVLLLPKGARKKEIAGARHVVVSRLLHPDETQKRVFYEVRNRDQLSEIAAAFLVTESELSRWNVLNTEAHLRGGMTLQILVDRKQDLSHVRYIDEKQATVLLAGSAEFHEHFEGLKGKQRVQIAVQKGDTLRKLGARYGMSVGSMERVNRRSRKTKLVRGEKLIVYTTRKVAANRAEIHSRQELPELKPPRPDLL